MEFITKRGVKIRKDDGMETESKAGTARYLVKDWVHERTKTEVGVG